jgi:putative transposase
MAGAVKRLSPPDSKTEIARQLGLSRSALYYLPKLPAKDMALKAGIEKAMSDHKSYGHKRLAIHLGINKKRALRVMKLFNLKVKRKRKIPAKPKDRNQESAAIPNLISGLTVDAPNQVWVSDFTYLPFFGKFVYLATVEDIFTRKAVGWAISTRHSTGLVVLALLDAALNNPLPKIIHSDQGSEYRNVQYLNLLKSLNIQPSMSAKSSPWQNGYQESFYSGFKLELGHPEIYADLGELYEAIAQQIYYYNNLRIHTALKCPPAVFAERLKYQNNLCINQANSLRLFVEKMGT